jgi:hypothetical protein
MSLISFDNITDGSIHGNGTFDKAMASVNNHLKQAMDDQLLKQSDVGMIYGQIIPGMFQSATQFELEKELKNTQISKTILEATIVYEHEAKNVKSKVHEDIIAGLQLVGVQ